MNWDGSHEDTTDWPNFHDVILIRHGEHYQNIPPYGLTSSGVVQAETTGQYLQNLVQNGRLKIGYIVHSEMPRAVETAQCIYRKLQPLQPSVDLESSDLLNEGVIPKEPSISQNVSINIILNIIGLQLYRVYNEGFAD